MYTHALLNSIYTGPHHTTNIPNHTHNHHFYLTASEPLHHLLPAQLTTTQQTFKMGLSADQQSGLNVQNNGRKQKGLQPLKWDDHLAQEAQKWATNLAKNIGHMQHSTGEQRPNQGENLFWAMSSPGPYKDPYAHAAQAWMNEAAKYHGEKIGEGTFGSYGHYSE